MLHDKEKTNTKQQHTDGQEGEGLEDLCDTVMGTMGGGFLTSLWRESTGAHEQNEYKIELNSISIAYAKEKRLVF